MALIITLIVAIIFLIATGAIVYFVEFDSEMGCKSEDILKDGLVNELLHKATNNPMTEFEISNGKIKAGRFEIRKNYAVFWFPYYVHRCALPYKERTDNANTWDERVGYVVRFSSDWRLIKALHKSKSVNKELTQREKLNLNK
jgi:hypothetical protein